jgi:ADP-heptose:LPS heptosyltransferase
MHGTPSDDAASARAARIPARRILVARLGSLGDVVRTRFALPGLRELYPDARIDWLVEDRAASGLTGASEIDEVIAVPRRALRIDSALRLGTELIRSLRAREYDLAVDFHSVLRSALPLWASRIPVRVGYGAAFAREGAQHFFTHRVDPAARHVSRFERNAALVRFLGGTLGCARPALQLPDEDGELPGLPERFAVLHPGTSPTTLYKRWEPERYARVARGLAGEAGLRSVVTWGPVPGERECAEQVVAAAGGSAELGPRTQSLGVLLRLLGRASLFIGSDSGPLHLASLAGRPIVAIFGPTDPVENAPFPGLPVRLVRVDVGCNPCREGCPVRSCMAAVEPARVLAAARELLAGAALSGRPG